MVGSVSGAALRDLLSMSSSGSHTLSDFVTCATVPAKQVFFIYSLDDLATTAADKLSRFIKQSLGTNEFEPVGHGWGLSCLNRLISVIRFLVSEVLPRSRHAAGLRNTKFI